MAKRNPHPEGTREDIRNTATKLFTQNGVHASSLSDISEAAGISKGTLYYHYPSKEELVLEIAEEYFAAFTALIYHWIDELRLNTPAKDAIRTVAGFFWRDNESMRLYFALLAEALREDGALRALCHAKQKEWAVLLEVGALKLSGADTQRFRTYSRCFLALLDGFALRRLLSNELDESLLYGLLLD